MLCSVERCCDKKERERERESELCGGMRCVRAKSKEIWYSWGRRSNRLQNGCSELSTRCIWRARAHIQAQARVSERTNERMNKEIVRIWPTASEDCRPIPIKMIFLFLHHILISSSSFLILLVIMCTRNFYLFFLLLSFYFDFRHCVSLFSAFCSRS